MLTQVTSYLARQGHDVSLISLGSAEEPDFYPVGGTIRRIWLGSENVQVPTGIFDLLQRVKKLREVIRRVNPDVAIGFMHSAYIPLALALSGSRVPVLASEHTSFDHFQRLPLQALLLRVAAPFFARMTVVSEAVKSGFPHYLAKRMTVVPNPVTAVKVVADAVGGPEKTLLTVGRLAEEKDQGTLIRAFASLARAHPRWKLRIVGEGPLRSELESLAAASGIRSRVEFVGAVRDIEGEYATVQLFATSSRYESFGLATAEALSAGIPAIGFADCPGTNELIKPDVNGLLVEGADRVAAMAAGLNFLMSSQQARERMSAEAPMSVQAFTLDSIGSRWDALLNEVVAGKVTSVPN